MLFLFDGTKVFRKPFYLAIIFPKMLSIFPNNNHFSAKITPLWFIGTAKIPSINLIINHRKVTIV